MTTTLPQTSTAIATTTTTLDFSDVCGDANVVHDLRPDVALTLVEGVTTEDGCCTHCNVDDDCVAWQFLKGANECNKATKENEEGEYQPWVGMIKAEGFVFGTKRVNTCDGCDFCGSDPTDVFNQNKYCSPCANGTHWNQYPCFVEHACMCVDSTTSTTTGVPTPAPITTTPAHVCSTEVQDGQPDVESTVSSGVSTQSACCAACDADPTCAAWQFYSGFLLYRAECRLVDATHTWTDVKSAKRYVFGAKVSPTTAAPTDVAVSGAVAILA